MTLSPFASPQVQREDATDGVVLRSAQPLAPYEENVGSWLRRWACERPDVPFLLERDPAGAWRSVNYRSTLDSAWAIGQALLERGLSPDRPLMILSANSIDHALIALAAQLVGIPAVPVSAAYSLSSRDFGKLKAIADLVRPGVIYAENEDAFRPALENVERNVEVVTSAPSRDSRATPLSSLIARSVVGPLAWCEAECVDGDTVAKILFTSGSTAEPKGVLNTHRMLCANQQMLAQVWPFVRETPPILVDWLPWSHTFGGNHNFNLVLSQGGTMYIDGGRPAPALVETTVSNVTSVSPNLYFNVPAGFGAVLPILEQDDELASRFLRRIEVLFYAGAALPQDLWERLDRLTRVVRGEPVMITTAWGSTETAPLATSAHFRLDRAGNIGVPVPGVDIKLVPAGAKHELRVRGPNVTPGYAGRPDLTEAAFDRDGFYRIGDAGRLADPADPSKGIIFEGRIAEDFKLTTGTWVSCGKVRVESVAAMSPWVQDAVVAGADRDYVALLVWLNVSAASRLTEIDDPTKLAAAPAIHDAICRGLAAYNERNSGSSMRIARALVMQEGASIDAGEITDKGYVNQRATLDRRAPLVESLFADPPGPEVIILDEPVGTATTSPAMTQP